VQKLLKPAIFLLNQLNYKKKLSFFFFIMFLPFLIFAGVKFIELNDEKKIFLLKQESLKYNGILTTLLLNLQEHRGIIGAYLSGDISLKNRVLRIERNIDKAFSTILKLDSSKLNLYKNSPTLVNLIGEWEKLKLKNISQNSNQKKSFEKHTNLIKNTLFEIQNINKKIGFKTTNHATMHYLESMIDDKLPNLSEYIGQARGLGASKLTKTQKSKEDERRGVYLYGVIKSNLDAVEDYEVSLNEDNQNKIFLKIKKANEISNSFLNLLNSEIINKDNLTYDAKTFFKAGSKAIYNIFDLHSTLILIYQDILESKITKLEKKLLFYLGVFILTSLILFYIFTAFYQSLIRVLKKLQLASIRISEGENDVVITSNTKDEFNDVIKAFNIMGQNIKTNVSFLNGYKMAIDESSIVSKSDKRGIITYVNKKFCLLSGYKEDELMGRPHSMIRHPDMPKEAFKEMWDTLKSKKIWNGIVKNRKKDGGHYFVNATIIPILDDRGELAEYVAVRHDVTELEDKKAQLQKQRIDILTGLYNRNQMIEDLNKMKSPVLMLLNINSFGELNDFYGSKIGDEVLQGVSKLLKQISSTTKIDAYRLHADEFAFLSDSDTFSHDKYKSFISKVINYIESNKIKCNDDQISITFTAGIAFSDSLEETNNELTSLLANANSALRDAKKSNKKYLTYDLSMRERNNYAKNMQSVEMIKDAISNDRIVTYFQPIIDNKTGEISKYESLVRLIKEDGSVVSPFFFLDIAKKAKLYNSITKIVVKKTFEEFRNTDLEFSINLSPEDIQDKGTVDYIKNVLISFPKTQRVIFEIVESEVIEDYEEISNFIKDVKKFGVKIAIDDFGSGYSNFEHILTLDVDFLKIDGSLIKNIDKDENSRIITTAIIAFCKKLNRKTVVEFVHNEEVYNLAIKLGADYSQGFYLGEPAPKPKVTLHSS